MSKQWKSAFLWFFGVVGTGVTVLSLAAVVIGFIHHVPFDILSGAVYTWAAVFFIIAVVPILMVLFGIADKQMGEYFNETGRQMIIYYNIIAWILWPVVIIRLLVRRMCPPDENIQDET